MTTVRASLASVFVGALASLVIAGCATSPTTGVAPAAAPAPAPPQPVAVAPAAPPVAPVAAARPTATTKKAPVTTKTPMPKKKPRYTCEPNANAQVDPTTNIIINKSCPAINAAKERAQRKYAEQQKPSSRSMRDANGETYYEYCKRTGQAVATCAAG